MRIAVCGSHRVGKTTLVERLADELPGYATFDEPYHLLEAGGYASADPPTLEDFEAQLACSIASIAESGPDCILDRCPADILAYVTVHRDRASFDFDAWLPKAQKAVAALDLIVFVPIESPDRVRGSESEYGQLRRAVDDELRAIVVEDCWSFDRPVLEVSGSVSERARQVLAAMPAG